MAAHTNAYTSCFTQPWLSASASRREDSIRELYSALRGIRQCWDTSSAELIQEGVQHLRLAKKHLRTRPLDIVLQSPPKDVPLDVYIALPSGKTMISALITIPYLRRTVVIGKGAYSRMWPFDESIWTFLLRWADYLLPLEGDCALDSLMKIRDFDVTDKLVSTVLGIFECIASLPKSAARKHFTSHSNRALHTLTCLWAQWPKILKAHHITVATVINFPTLFADFWQVFEPDTAHDLIGTRILRLKKYNLRKLLRLCTAHLRMLSRASDYVSLPPLNSALVASEVSVMRELLHGYTFGTRTLSHSFVSALVTILDDTLRHSPVHHGAVEQLVSLLFAFCMQFDHALILAMKYGLFPLIIRLRQSSPRRSSLHSSLEGAPQPLDGMTNAFLELFGRILCCPRGVRSFHEARAKYAPRLSDIFLVEEEKALLDLAERRHELLIRAESEWSSVAKCCYPLRGSHCGPALAQRRYTARVTASARIGNFTEGNAKIKGIDIRLQDVYFLVAIARAYVEENYGDILSRAAGYTIACTSLSVYLRLDASGVQCNYVSLGGGLWRDDCWHPTVNLSLSYERSDGLHDRMIMLTPRAAASARLANDVRLLTEAFYDPPLDCSGLMDIQELTEFMTDEPVMS
ncbi:uncharacterized protein SCHCODRAFT_01153557 [Schizophyllum commune H4-8]|nr:uncharacterized protein SCHCODRAFT_01153557 [Schizophyllum commune H4-8]KAI5890887.1 hypothetical protein SCHCODRAFT_01153557 [Schizophyllum commune H4-8]